jgi:chromosome segregation ATPase
MMENEDYFDTLQDAHDQLAERCGRMEMALSNNAELRDSQEEQVATLTRANEELQIMVKSMEKDNLDLESQLKESHLQVESKTFELVDAARQIDVTSGEYAAHIDACERRISEMAIRISEVDTLRSLLSLRESELESREEESKDLRDEVKAWERRLADKDMLVQQLKDKVGTKQYEIDETRIKAESEIKELQGKLADVEKISMDLVEQVSQPIA